MQKFSYHTHTNALGIFDGHHSAAEMIRRAEEIGYEEIGISNHLVYHPNLLTTSPMFFNDFDLLKKMMQKNVDDIRRAAEKASIPVYAGFDALPCKGVIIDFSSPAGAVAAAQYGAANGLPCVICSTGLSREDEAALEAASTRTPIFRSANMSVGVNVLIELARQATKILGGEFDIEIIEKHHHNKLDAPSGTALMIADAINTEANGKYEYVYDRTQVRQKRGAQELGISSIRGGGIVGEHDVLFCGPDEVVTLSHSAGSRGVFADGAVQAALYIAALAPGYYTMTDLLRGKLICE